MQIKAVYKKLLYLETLPPATAEKKLLEYGMEKNNQPNVYLLHLLSLRRLIMFKYKIILRILPTNGLLYKIKRVLSQLPILPLQYPYYLELVYRMYVS